ELLIVLLEARNVVHHTASGRARRRPADDLLRNWIEARYRHLLARKGLIGGRVDDIGFAGREVAGALGRGWRDGGIRSRSRPKIGPLVEKEKESLVAANGPSNGTAILVSFESILHGGKEVARVQVAVPHEREQGAMKLVGPTARDCVHYAAAPPREFGAVIV